MDVADEALTSILASILGSPAEAISVRREPSPFATLATVERLMLDRTVGPSLSLFMKRVGCAPSHPDKDRRDREVHVYSDLFRGYFDLPVPVFYGCAESHLFLEYVDDWNLQYHDLNHWFQAADRLAHLHQHFAGRAAELRHAEFLLQLDKAYMDGWAERAIAAVAEHSTLLGSRLRRVVDRYAPAVTMLCRQPPTLVHNDLSPKNVLADRHTTPARIVFVDWEMAGVGCGLLDLVHLAYGLDAAATQTMVAKYRAVLRGTGLLPEDDKEFAALRSSCELHKTIYRLAHCRIWGLPGARVAEWVDAAETLINDVRHHGAGTS